MKHGAGRTGVRPRHGREGLLRKILFLSINQP